MKELLMQYQFSLWVFFFFGLNFVLVLGNLMPYEGV